MPNLTAARGPRLDILVPTAMVLVVIAAMAALPSWRETRLRWLAEHHVLVAAAADPFWELPGGIAGLDVRRCILLFLVLVIVAAYASSWLWHEGRRIVQRRLMQGDRS